MALHNLVITVVDGGKTGGLNWGSSLNEKNTKRKKSEEKDTKLYKMLHFNQEIKGKVKQSVSPLKFFAMSAGVGLVTQSAKQVINYYVSDIGRRNGDSNYQAMVGRNLEKATDGLSVLSGAFYGAATGSVLGPWGAAIGAVIGAASSGTNLGFKYAERERAYQHEMFKENNSQAYNLARANYTALTGRVR